ncbi:MAG: beta-lactamase family protein [Sphingobacteriales bacterium]|jgi:CubicO group peptidase (beta-lactamase class C family)|nr:MAG: beta-lactamase family protein [Sphingobacteriales bacterium]
MSKKFVEIKGYAKEGFEKVRDVFQYNFYNKKEVGASCCVFFEGEKVVDLYAGFKDSKRTQEWTADTLSILFSTTKGISSIAMAMLHSRQLLNYDEKVAHYWPEFAANGKENITIRELFSHQAGLFSNDKSFNYETLCDENKLSNCLAKQKPYWKVGNRQGYHAWTIAMYQNELMKRIDPQKRNLAQFVQEEIAQPLNIELYIGFPAQVDWNRKASCIPFSPTDAITGGDNRDFGRLVKNIVNPFSMFYKSLLNPPFALNLNNFNNIKYISLQNGSALGFGNACSLATIYNDLATGGKKLNISAETLEELSKPPIAPKVDKIDLVLGVDIPFSLGFAKPSPYQDFGVDYKAFGTFGAGGSGAFADPTLQLSFAYVMNKMGTHIANDPRELALRQATYESVLALEHKKLKEKAVVMHE